MQVTSASELLAFWERARAEPITTQALLLLEAASPGVSQADLARLSVGQRDACLLNFRELLFGSTLTGIASCPECKQQIQIEIDSTDIRVDRDQPAGELLTAESGGYVARFRLPNNEDLRALTDSPGDPSDEAATVGKLLSRCVIELRRRGRKQKLRPYCAFPPPLIEAIAAEMEKADPQANIQLPLDCLDCGHRWLSAFDIVGFLWSEIDSLAKRLLREVCALALAFGWRESDILSMSAQRRQLYLELIGEAN
jgi:hypothetical protein